MVGVTGKLSYAWYAREEQLGPSIVWVVWEGAKRGRLSILGRGGLVPPGLVTKGESRVFFTLYLLVIFYIRSYGEILTDTLPFCPSLYTQITHSPLLSPFIF